ncbi:GNAT family N-acetyltransferase [Oryzifoliimicrobium ureilyticus]|uniref:GNAT family N-acetyltransferase n=1 Tax=Oryzifoliimicrobium ureilyticus TaxID=3113724 RepID=UPI003075F91A
MTEITIRPFVEADADSVISMILAIQRDEFSVPITADAQPDLRVIPDFYQTGDGQFWVAEHNGEIVGTLGLKDIGERQAALRKMFVLEAMRGPQHNIARQLLDALLLHANARQLRDIFLGTTEHFLAAHRFYEKNGFVEIGREKLPRSFAVMAVDSKFYHRHIQA